jgi:hypothetical protein
VSDPTARRFSQRLAAIASYRKAGGIQGRGQDFTDRVNANWAAASPEDGEAMKERTKRLSEELADNYVDQTIEAYDVDEAPER